MAIYRDNRTGQLYEEKNGKLVPYVDHRAEAFKQQAEETGFGEAAFAQAGRGMHSVYRGIANILDPEGIEERNREYALSDEAFGALSEAAPVASIVGGALPYLGAAALTGGSSIPATLAGVGIDVGLGAAAGYERGNASDALEGGAWGLAGLVAPGLRAGYGAARTRMADRVAARIADQAAGISDEILAPAERQANMANDFLTSTVKVNDTNMPMVDRLRDAPDVAGDALDDLTQGPAGSVGAAGEGAVPYASYHDELVSMADDTGLEITTAQRSGNAAAEQAENVAQNIPGMSGFADARMEKNQQVMANRIGEAFGVATNEINPMVMGEISAKLDRGFERIARGVKQFKLPEKFWDDMAELRKESGDLPIGRDFSKVLDNIEDLKGRTVDGSKMMAIRQNLNSEYASLLNSGDVKANYMREVMNSFDRAIVDQAGPDLGARYAALRQQYRLKLALDSHGVINPKGDLNYPSLYNAMRRVFPREMTTGNQGTLFRAVTAARRFGVGAKSSGTAENIYQLAGNIAGRGAFAVADKLKKATKRAKKP